MPPQKRATGNEVGEHPLPRPTTVQNASSGLLSHIKGAVSGHRLDFPARSPGSGVTLKLVCTNGNERIK